MVLEAPQPRRGAFFFLHKLSPKRSFFVYGGHQRIVFSKLMFVKGEKMTNAKKITSGVALIALGLPALLVALGSGPANAASVTSTIDTYDVCSWEFSGLNGTLDLVPINPDTTAPLAEGTKYLGDKLQLGVVSNITMALTGNASPGTGLDGTSAQCSFYGDLKYPSLSAALATGAGKTDLFTASYTVGEEVRTDTDLSVQLGAGSADGNGANPLVASIYSQGFYAVRDAGEEPTAFGAAITGLSPADRQCISSSVGMANSIMRGYDPDHSFTNKMIMWSTAVEGKYEAGLAPRCNTGTLLTFYIPNSTGAPDAAGREFTLSGPEVIYSLSSVSSVPATPVDIPSPGLVSTYYGATLAGLIPYLSIFPAP